MGHAIYQGQVHHRRLGAPEYAFSHPLWMLLLDLGRVAEPSGAEPFLSTTGAAPVRWRRRDHLGPPGLPLDEAARALVRKRIGIRPAGPVRLLTMPRMLGVGFNPVSFYYLHGASGDLEATIAEVTSTPWRERYHYVQGAEGGRVSGEVAKRMHVSPFMPIEQTYEVSIDEPGRSLTTRIASREDGKLVFEASLSLARRDLDAATVRRLVRRQPLQPLAVLARIYGHALRLRLRGGAVHRRRPATRNLPPAALEGRTTSDMQTQPKEDPCESA